MKLRQAGQPSQVADACSISFSPLQEADLPLIYRWLNTPGVYRWVGGQPRTHAEICAKYLPRIRGEEPTKCFLIRVHGTPIGHIQTYRIADCPEYESQVGLREDLAGVDLFIGEAAYRHRGLGARILGRFLASHVFDTTASTGCILSPDPANKAAIRAYQKAGFVPVKHIQTSRGAELLMHMGREAFRVQRHRSWLGTAARLAIVPYLTALGYLTLRPSYPQAIEATYSALGRGYLHIPAYFGLGVLAFMSLRSRNLLRQASFAFTASVAYGTILELLQAFVPGRTPNGLGILFDALGAAAAIAMMVLVRRYRTSVQTLPEAEGR